MNIQKFGFSAIIMIVVMLAGIGITIADEDKMTDQQYCEKEAKEAGMSAEKDVAEYITQCMAEVEETKSAKTSTESGS
jgi:predicted chitinase